MAARLFCNSKERESKNGGRAKKPDLVQEISTASLLHSRLWCCFRADKSGRFGASAKMNIEVENENGREVTNLNLFRRGS
jgi:hypothetical protein